MSYSTPDEKYKKYSTLSRENPHNELYSSKLTKYKNMLAKIHKKTQNEDPQSFYQNCGNPNVFTTNTTNESNTQNKSNSNINNQMTTNDLIKKMNELIARAQEIGQRNGTKKFIADVLDAHKKSIHGKGYRKMFGGNPSDSIVLQNAQDDLQRHGEIVEKVVSGVKSLKEQNTKLETVARFYRDRFKHLITNAEQIRDEINTKENQIQNIRDEIVLMKRTNETTLEENNKKHQRTLQSAQQRNDALIKEFSVLQREHEQLKHNFETRDETQTEQLDTRIRELENEIKNNNKSNQVMIQKHKNDIEQQNEKLRTLMDEYVVKISAIEKEKEELTRDLSDHQKIIADLKVRIHDIEEACGKILKEHKNLFIILHEADLEPEHDDYNFEQQINDDFEEFERVKSKANNKNLEEPDWSASEKANNKNLEESDWSANESEEENSEDDR